MRTAPLLPVIDGRDDAAFWCARLSLVRQFSNIIDRSRGAGSGSGRTQGRSVVGEHVGHPDIEKKLPALTDRENGVAR
jgi:hypothetical protein